MKLRLTSRPRLPRWTALAALAALAAALAALAGCGKSPAPTAPAGDTGGTHLLVFASDRNQAAGQFDLYLYDLDAGGYRLIKNISSSSAADVHPAISSDGLLIAFQSNRGAGTGSDIYLYSRYNQALVTLNGVNTARDETEPAFTGDAVKLAFTQALANGHTRVRLLDGIADTLMALPGLDTTDVAPYSDWAPSPNRDGSRIAFVSDRGGNPDIYVWDKATRSLLNLPDLISAGNDVDPSMSFDSRWVAFASDRAGGLGGYDVYLYDTLNKVFIVIQPMTTFDERHPAISQSGNYIAFQSQQPGPGGWDPRLLSVSPPGEVLLSGASSSRDDIDPYLLYP
jgi:Tol biopolymer transport system component